MNTADGRIALPAKLGKAVEDRSGTEIILGVRPHNMAIVAPGAKTKSLRGGISLIEQLGTETLVDIDMDGFAVQACLPPTTDLNDGEAVGLTIDFSKVHIFDAATEDAICHGMNHIGPR